MLVRQNLIDYIWKLLCYTTTLTYKILKILKLENTNLLNKNSCWVKDLWTVALNDPSGQGTDGDLTPDDYTQSLLMGLVCESAFLELFDTVVDKTVGINVDKTVSKDSEQNGYVAGYAEAN